MQLLWRQNCIWTLEVNERTSQKICQTTYVENLWVKKWTVYTFDNEKLKEITTAMVNVKLKTTSAEPLTTRSSVVPHLTGTVLQS